VTDKLIRTYNEQGNYSIRQSYSAISFSSVKTSWMQGFVNTMLVAFASLLVVLNCAIFFFWLRCAVPQPTMKSFFELSGSPIVESHAK